MRISDFMVWLETNWESFNNETYWGVNSVTAAIEDDRDIGIVILFKGNVCNNVIRHLPSACRIKGIPFVSITKSVIMPKKTPVAQINAVGIGRANTVLMELSRPLISKCNIT
ncbi:LOW QUALITY PROTEIN: hypothetical protein X943_001608 [Babesia divergens]|uniref:Uncharacterized protein n=1 Tax=Babesia divergens TaxID=32595 RepID=A0AAD9GJV3_BABDI|nr:LOW QUALITY PROTEIN: hypothetical protein X943_001608 [Babesia divergens]